MIPLNWKTDDTPASTYTGFGDLITNDTEVTISEVSGKTWYVIANDSSTVTLLSKESFGNQVFNWTVKSLYVRQAARSLEEPPYSS